MDGYCVQWHEMKYRKVKATEEQAALIGVEAGEEIEIYDCELPGDGEEVLITTSFGTVEIDTFHCDEFFGFENREDPDEVIAWATLPEPFKKEPEANDRPCEKCKHKVETKPGVEACDVWECSFEPKDEQS